MTQTPTDADLAALALQLIERVDLKGSEVPSFVAVSNWLTAICEEAQITEVSPAPRGIGAV